MSNIEENKENKQNNENIINNNKDIENNVKINDVINAFKYFDIKKNGKVDIKELKYILSNFGNKMKEDEIKNIFKKLEIDYNQNKELDYEEIINS